MSFKLKLSIVNQFFVFVGGGSVKYSGSKWILIKYLCRLIPIYVHGKDFMEFYETLGIMMTSFARGVLSIEPTSLVLFACMCVMTVAPVLGSVWRLCVDDSLSTTLSKIENVHAAMVNLNVVTRVKKRSVWLIVMMFLIDYAMNVFFRGSNIIAENSRTPWSFTKQALVFIGMTNNRFATYEYYATIIFIQWALYKINKELEKPSTSDLNKSIYGTSVLFNIIMFDIAIVSWTIFTGVFIPLQTGNVNYWRLFSNVLIVFLILFDLFSLYFLAHITEKEVNRTSVILNKRFVVETNPKNRRKISFFLLRRSHENFHFQLCGFYIINFKQLLVLLSKTLAFLIIQIEFKLK